MATQSTNKLQSPNTSKFGASKFQAHPNLIAEALGDDQDDDGIIEIDFDGNPVTKSTSPDEYLIEESDLMDDGLDELLAEIDAEDEALMADDIIDCDFI